MHNGNLRNPSIAILGWEGGPKSLRLSFPGVHSTRANIIRLYGANWWLAESLADVTKGCAFTKRKCAHNVSRTESNIGFNEREGTRPVIIMDPRLAILVLNDPVKERTNEKDGKL